MVAPKPYGLHIKNGVPTERDAAYIASVVRRFLAFKDAAQIENLKEVYDLPDGGVAIFQEVANVFRVIVDKSISEKTLFLEQTGLAKKYIPMFFSGVATKTTFRSGEKVAFKLTEQCRQRLLKSTGMMPSKEIALERFTFEPDSKFYEFSAPPESIVRWSQYRKHSHNWYGGTMGQVHQLVGGYGRQDFDNLPDDRLEQARIILPEKIIDSIWKKYENLRLPGYEGVPPKEGTFQYDYKWSKTHGISFDTNGKPWLIQVSGAVWAMPLPIIPLTANAKFRQYVEEELSDNEILKVLDVFGAMPSGESFPDNQEDFQRWVRAGVIIRICDTGDFLQHHAMFSACGWSFNLPGNMAFNTGYRYDETTGLIYCSTFKLSLTLGGSAHYYGTEAVNSAESTLTPEELIKLRLYIAGIFEKLTNAKDSLRKTVSYKLRHIAQSELLERSEAININYEAEVDYWDQYESTPIANHSGSVLKVYNGWLYHPAKYENQPQIKFPEIYTNICQSFDFTPTERGWVVQCDTIMYAYFDGNDLKVLKYFYDGYGYKKEVDTNYEDCMSVGKWYWNETVGEVTLTGNFYTTDITEIDESAETTIQTTMEGKDLGFDSQPFFEFDYFFSRPGSLWRNRYFSHLTKTTRIDGGTFDLALLVPMYNRFTALHARQDSYERKSSTESMTLGGVRDPTSYRYWTHDHIFAWNGGLSVMNGKPYPKDGNPVWVEIENYNPSLCSDFADQGPWIPSLPADYTWLIHPDRMKWNHSGGGGAPPLKVFNNSVDYPVKDDTGDLKWMVNSGVSVISQKKPDEHYFKASPDQYGSTMYRESCKVSFGDSEYVNISESNGNGGYKSFGSCSLVDGRKIYHFIGVINE